MQFRVKGLVELLIPEYVSGWCGHEFESLSTPEGHILKWTWAEVEFEQNFTS